MGIIISGRLATLNELQTVYSLEDAFNLLEALIVQNYNQWVMMEETESG